MAGRPRSYSPELAEKVLDLLSDGMTLLEICRREDMPSRPTVHRWVLENTDGFSAKYARAREVQLLGMADDLTEIADDATNDWMRRQRDEGEDEDTINHEHISRSRLRIDTRKWLLAKLMAHTYGEKVQHGGDPENPVVHRIERVIVGSPNPDSPSLPAPPATKPL